jgi:DNA-binding transcriptional regulator YiaG
VPLGPGDLSRSALERAIADRPRYALAMAGYVRWLAARFAALGPRLAQRFAALRAAADAGEVTAVTERRDAVSELEPRMMPADQSAMATRRVVCLCRVPDLAALRAALGLTQTELALLLRTSARRIREYEHPPHRCLPPAQLGYLRGYLRSDPWRSLVASVGLAHPYPEDVAAWPRAEVTR